jgi:DNA repair ATPase RecN
MKRLVKEVSVAYNPAHYQANKAAYAAKSKAWREKNKERTKANRKRNYEENKERNLLYSTNYNRLRKVGITPEEYAAKLKEQDGVCAICGAVCTRALAADHNHVTRQIRGLLCNSCNRGLGYFHDCVRTLQAAAAYLKHYEPLNGADTGAKHVVFDNPSYEDWLRRSKYD